MKKLLSKCLELLLVIAMIVLSVPSGTEYAMAAADVVSIELTVTYGQTEARTMLAMVNKFRTGDEAWYWDSDDTTKIKPGNLEKLIYDYDLEAAAMQRAAELAVYYNHMRPSGKDCFTAYDWTGFCAENIAYGYESAKEVFDGWKEDNEPYMGQGHRRNMLNGNIKAFAVGHAVYNGRHYWVQEFRGNVVADGETLANDSETKCTVDTMTSIANDFNANSADDNQGDVIHYSIKFNKSSLKIKKGKSVSLKYSVTKGYTGKVKFSSSNKKIARVSSKGKVRAVKKGKCKVTARLSDGSKAVIKITVK